MEKIKKYTLETCLQSALKFKTRKQWQTHAQNYYKAALKRGWLNLCAQHMPIDLSKEIRKWTKENILKEALKYKTRGEWGKNQSTSYNLARERGYFVEATKHMHKVYKEHTKEMLMESAKKYPTRFEWFKSDEASYRKAKRIGYFKECVKHMPPLKNKMVTIKKINGNDKKQKGKKENETK